MEHQYIVNDKQLRALGGKIHARRVELGLSMKQLGDQAGVNASTVLRLERGVFAEPRPDTLIRLAEALDLDPHQTLAQARFQLPALLPSFQPYLRSKYRGIPAAAIEDLDEAFERIIKKHGYHPDGPLNGEDEHPIEH